LTNLAPPALTLQSSLAQPLPWVILPHPYPKSLLKLAARWIFLKVPKIGFGTAKVQWFPQKFRRSTTLILVFTNNEFFPEKKIVI